MSKRVSISRSKYHDYAKVADNFFSGSDCAREFEYWNAAGVLIVHAAIAYTDAITIKVGGVKSQGEDHMAVIDLLREVVALDEHGQRALNHLIRMIEQKNLVSYSGEIYTRTDIEKLWKQLERYRDWALFILGKV
ncbi:MAG: hypothetical protein HYT97_07490 [Elusimicrobia bacterium]|nr:hypothetical protein [Elusimicrobiota bacterium]